MPLSFWRKVMLSIESILKYMHENLSEPRFKKVNEEHVMDDKTGIELHMYDDWFKITKGEDIIATIHDFSPMEQKYVWGIKQAITDPAKAKEKEENYHKDMAARRSHLAKLFEYPEPAKSVIVEEGTSEYAG
jgi:hypothetical protein